VLLSSLHLQLPAPVPQLLLLLLHEWLWLWHVHATALRSMHATNTQVCVSMTHAANTGTANKLSLTIWARASKFGEITWAEHQDTLTVIAFDGCVGQL
jgi:hypothetical protein